MKLSFIKHLLLLLVFAIALASHSSLLAHAEEEGIAIVSDDAADAAAADAAAEIAVDQAIEAVAVDTADAASTDDDADAEQKECAADDEGDACSNTNPAEQDEPPVAIVVQADDDIDDDDAATATNEQQPQEQQQGEEANDAKNCPSRPHVIRCAAKYLDTNRNGALERQELVDAMKNVSWIVRGLLRVIGSVDSIMKKCDADGDGRITIEHDMEATEKTCLASCFKRKAFKRLFFPDCTE